MAARIRPVLGVPSGTSSGFNRFGSLGAPMGAATAAAPPASRRLGFLFRGQLSAILPVDLAGNELLDLGHGLLIDTRNESQRLT